MTDLLARFSGVLVIFATFGVLTWPQVAGMPAQTGAPASPPQPNAEDDTQPELVSDGGNPVIRFAVAAPPKRTINSHFHFGFGYLYFSRDRIRYDVVVHGEARDGFDLPRSEFQSVRIGKFLGMGGILTKWKFKHGEYEFYHVRKGPFETPEVKSSNNVDKLITSKLGRQNILDPLPLIDAANDFEAVVIKTKPLVGTHSNEATAPLHSGSQEAAVLHLSVTPPGAQVYLDDVFKGTTREDDGTLTLDDLPVGTYILRMSLPGFQDWTESLKLGNGNSAVYAALTPKGPIPLTSSDIQDLLRNGVAKARISSLVTKYGVDFQLTPEIEQQMKAAGADNVLLIEIKANKK